MIEDFARVLYAGVLPNIGTNASVAGGFKQWIVGSAYVPCLPETNKLELQRVGVEAFTRAVSFDYERFALAAQESHLVALSERERFGAVAWPLLKQYYSAFFSAHAIMRSRGAGVVRIDNKQARELTTTLKAYLGATAEFSAGTYSFSIYKSEHDQPGEITVKFCAFKDGKGVHEGFWSTFIEYLEGEAKSAVDNSLPDNQDFVAHALELKQSVMSGGAVWISKIRNEINYQHEHEAWMPMTKRSTANIAIPRLAENNMLNARLDIDRSKYPIKSFFCVCCYLSILNCLISSKVSEKSKGGGAFGQRWNRLLASTALKA